MIAPKFNARMVAVIARLRNWRPTGTREHDEAVNLADELQRTVDLLGEDPIILDCTQAMIDTARAEET